MLLNLKLCDSVPHTDDPLPVQARLELLIPYEETSQGACVLARRDYELPATPKVGQTVEVDGNAYDAISVRDDQDGLVVRLKCRTTPRTLYGALALAQRLGFETNAR